VTTKERQRGPTHCVQLEKVHLVQRTWRLWTDKG
jgi:hypothetical protein